MGECYNNNIQFGAPSTTPGADAYGIHFDNVAPQSGFTYYFLEDGDIDCVANPSGASGNHSYGIQLNACTRPWVHGMDISLPTRGIGLFGNNANFNLTCNQ